MKEILTLLGYITTIIVVIQVLLGGIAWWRGILPAIYRLGNGFARRKIAIFAKGENISIMRTMLLNSKLFKEKNIHFIESEKDFEIAEKASIFLVTWHDWENEISKIIDMKKNNTALIMYSPQGKVSPKGEKFIPEKIMAELDTKSNVSVANFRGRAINDIIVSMISTG